MKPKGGEDSIKTSSLFPLPKIFPLDSSFSTNLGLKMNIQYANFKKIIYLRTFFQKTSCLGFEKAL
jgi:hypothetical protein